jgi:hypothetical protein
MRLSKETIKKLIYSTILIIAISGCATGGINVGENTKLWRFYNYIFSDVAISIQLLTPECIDKANNWQNVDIQTKELWKKALEKYTIIHVTVQNNGSKGAFVSEHIFKLVAEGVQYDILISDSWLFQNGFKNATFGEIAPGASKWGALFFPKLPSRVNQLTVFCMGSEPPARFDFDLTKDLAFPDSNLKQ